MIPLGFVSVWEPRFGGLTRGTERVKVVIGISLEYVTILESEMVRNRNEVEHLSRHKKGEGMIPLCYVCVWEVRFGGRVKRVTGSQS